MSDVSKIIVRETAKLDRQEEAVRITRTHIAALSQLELQPAGDKPVVKK